MWKHKISLDEGDNDSRDIAPSRSYGTIYLLQRQLLTLSWTVTEGERRWWSLSLSLFKKKKEKKKENARHFAINLWGEGARRGRWKPSESRSWWEAKIRHGPLCFSLFPSRLPHPHTAAPHHIIPVHFTNSHISNVGWRQELRVQRLFTGH